MRKQFCGGFLLLAAFLLAKTNIVQSQQKVVYCYWGTWSYLRTGDGKFEVGDIDPSLCTHIGYAFFGLDPDDRIISLNRHLDVDLKNIKNTIDLKKRNPSLKVLASIGGPNEGARFSVMANSPSKRAIFISSVMALMLKYNFDGLDLDWEYPAPYNQNTIDRVNYVTLLKELNLALKSRGLLLSVAVAAIDLIAQFSYDIPNVAKHVDLINLMAYNFWGYWEGSTGFNAPIKGQDRFNIKHNVDFWLKNGAPPSKLVLGLPTFGRSFTLANSAENSPGAPARGGGIAGPFTQDVGLLGYNEFCENLKSGWTRRFDAKHLVPYAFKGDQWVSYDDTESLNHKISYLKQLNFAGAMVWSIDTDDFRGKCGVKFPLLKAIKNGLNSSSTWTTTQPGTTRTTTTTTRAPNKPPNNGNCTRDGYFVNPTDCARYFQCVGGVRNDFSCPAGLRFNQATGMCMWPALANCHL